MRTRRVLTALLGAAILAQSIALCGLTGWHAFTRFPSADLARMDSQTSLQQAFAGTGLNDSLGELGKVPNRFAFGWLPQTLSREALSVATVGGPAALLVLVGLWPARRPHDPGDALRRPR